MDHSTDNPAGRLLQVLTYLSGSSDSPQNAMFVALGIEAQDLSGTEHARLIGDLASTADQAEAQVISVAVKLNLDPEPYLRWVPHTETIIRTISLNTGPSGSSLVSKELLMSLGVATDLLHRHIPEPHILQEQLTDLLASVRELIDAVALDGTLPPMARHYLLSRLAEVEYALLHFRISGYAGVEEAMERLLGGMLNRPDTQTEQIRGWWARFWDALHVSATGAKQLGDAGTSIFKALEEGRTALGR